MELVAPGLVNVIAVLAIVAGLVIAAWWTVGLYSLRKRREERQLSGTELDERQHETGTGVPPVLVVFFIVMGVSIVGYVIGCWIAGVSY